MTLQKLRYTSYNQEFSLPGVEGRWHLKMVDAKRTGGSMLVCVASRHGEEKWLDWETEVFLF